MASNNESSRIVTIAWVEAGHGYVTELSLQTKRACYGDALAQPLVLALIARLDLRSWSVFGRKRLASEWIEPGDRIELLPGLQVDPKVARLRRLQKRSSG